MSAEWLFAVVRFSALEFPGVHPINKMTNSLRREHLAVKAALSANAFFEVSSELSSEIR